MDSREHFNYLVSKGLLRPMERMLKLFCRVTPSEADRKATEEVRALYIALAEKVVERVPQGPERTVALRHLLDSKDCAIRGLLFDPPAGG